MTIAQQKHSVEAPDPADSADAGHGHVAFHASSSPGYCGALN